MTTFASHITKGTHAARLAATAVPTGSLYSCSDHSLIYQSDGATWSTYATLGSSSSGVLASTSYNPGSLSSYTTASTTEADVDATNLAVTFTAPASGKVLITLCGIGGCSGAATDNALWSLRESTTTVAGPQGAHTGLGAGNWTVSLSFVVTGLSAGSHTYKWGWKSNTGTVTARLYAGTGMQAVMIVTALP